MEKCILRFPSAVKKDRTVDAWRRGQADALRPYAEKWFAQMRQCGGDVRELLHDGCPVACVTDASGTSTYFGTMSMSASSMVRCWTTPPGCWTELVNACGTSN